MCNGTACAKHFLLKLGKCAVEPYVPNQTNTKIVASTVVVVLSEHMIKIEWCKEAHTKLKII